MSQKPQPGKLRNALSDLVSFVVTLVVIAFCLALLAALFSNGLAGAQEFIGSALAWVMDLFSRLQERIVGTAAGGVA